MCVVVVVSSSSGECSNTSNNINTFEYHSEYEFAAEMRRARFLRKKFLSLSTKFFVINFLVFFSRQTIIWRARRPQLKPNELQYVCTWMCNNKKNCSLIAFIYGSVQFRVCVPNVDSFLLPLLATVLGVFFFSLFRRQRGGDGFCFMVFSRLFHTFDVNGVTLIAD